MAATTYPAKPSISGPSESIPASAERIWREGYNELIRVKGACHATYPILLRSALACCHLGSGVTDHELRDRPALALFPNGVKKGRGWRIRCGTFRVVSQPTSGGTRPAPGCARGSSGDNS
jgi:hypothetical protein